MHSGLVHYGLTDNFPVTLESGKSHSIFVPDEILVDILSDSEQRKIKACVTDQLWRRKYSKKFEYRMS